METVKDVTDIVSVIAPIPASMEDIAAVLATGVTDDNEVEEVDVASGTSGC